MWRIRPPAQGACSCASAAEVALPAVACLQQLGGKSRTAGTRHGIQDFVQMSCDCCSSPEQLRRIGVLSDESAADGVTLSQ